MTWAHRVLYDLPPTVDGLPGAVAELEAAMHGEILEQAVLVGTCQTRK